MKKTVVFLSFFIGLCILFIGSVIGDILATGSSDFVILLIIISGFLLVITAVLLCIELLPFNFYAFIKPPINNDSNNDSVT